MNAFILEDDIVQQQRLKRVIDSYAVEKHQDINVTSTSRPQELLALVTKTLTYNVYFLDIEIKTNEQAGLELAQKIRLVDPFGWIVFVTTHSELLPITYKYKVAALDFIEKTENIVEFKKRVAECLDVVCATQTSSANADIFTFKNKNSDFHIPFSEILYFETTESAHKIRLVTPTKHSEFYATLSEIEKLDDRFFKSHRAYVINLNSVRRVDKAEKIVYFDGHEQCLVSRGKLKPLLKRLSATQLAAN